MLLLRRLKAQLFSIDVFLHNVLRHIKTGTGHIVIASSLSRIDLKELVLSISSVKLDIKIGKSHIVQIFQ